MSHTDMSNKKELAWAILAYLIFASPFILVAIVAVVLFIVSI